MNQIFSFEKMLTPRLIFVIYILALIASVFGGIFLIFAGSFSLRSLITGITTIIFGSITARVYCELIMIPFKIHESTKKTAENITKFVEKN